MIKKKIYQLHRTLSVLIGIPIFLWALSGLLHPIMTNVRPVITTQTAPTARPDTAVFHRPLGPLLSAHGIREFYQAHPVFMEGSWYEQVSLQPDAVAVYLSLKDGHLLPDGDKQYAGFLARYFLTGNIEAKPAILSIRYLSKFTADYPSVNRILPVYQVAFDRPDGLNIFVNTGQGKFSYAKDDNRAAFNWFFGFFHTWSWLDRFPGWKAGIIAFILLLTLATTAIGLYIAFTTKPKVKKGHRVLKARRLHRLTALFAAFFTLAWASSGLLHAVQNSLPEKNGLLLFPEQFSVRSLPGNPAALFTSLSDQLPKEKGKDFEVTEVQYLTIHREPVMRIRYREDQGSAKAKKTDLMKDQQVMSPYLLYYNLNTGKIIKDGDRDYALFLAKSYLDRQFPAVGHREFSWEKVQASYQTKFDVDYNFSDKILPVWKISPDGKLRHTVFIHTGSRTLTKEPSVFGRIDAISFAFFHKHEFMGWAGKGVKDASTVIGVLLVLCMLIFGYRLYFLSRKKKRKNA